MIEIFLRLRKLLNQDKVILTETDTVPGLICKINSLKGAEKIYQIKNRPQNKPFAIFINHFIMLEQFLILNDLERFIFQKFLPGYFTFLIPFRAKNNNNVLAPDTLNFITSPVGEGRIIGVRIPKDLEILEFIKFLKIPLIATSANLSNHKTPLNLEEVAPLIKENIDFLWKRTGHASMENSTIIDISESDKIEEEILKNSSKSPYKLLNKEEKHIIFTKNMNFIKSFLNSKITRNGSGIINNDYNV